MTVKQANSQVMAKITGTDSKGSHEDRVPAQDHAPVVTHAAATQHFRGPETAIRPGLSRGGLRGWVASR